MDTLPRLSIAYEPVWAIGNPSHHATPDQAQQAHEFIRHRFGQIFDDKSAQALTVQYGGSVEPDNAASFFSRPDVDGALIGGASLHADQFIAIVRTAIDKTHSEGNSASRCTVVRV
jgi:triosephosphate isomerase